MTLRIAAVWMLGLAMLASSPALGQSDYGPGFTIPWFTIDGGGGSTSGGPFELASTIGQFDARPVLSGGTFTIIGGFWVVPPACPGDVNGDRMVGLADIAEITGCWAQPTSCNPAADLDGNGFLGLGDLAQVTTHWADSCPF